MPDTAEARKLKSGESVKDYGVRIAALEAEHDKDDDEPKGRARVMADPRMLALLSEDQDIYIAVARQVGLRFPDGTSGSEDQAGIVLAQLDDIISLSFVDVVGKRTDGRFKEVTTAWSENYDESVVDAMRRIQNDPAKSPLAQNRARAIGNILLIDKGRHLQTFQDKFFAAPVSNFDPETLVDAPDLLVVPTAELGGRLPLLIEQDIQDNGFIWAGAADPSLNFNSVSHADFGDSVATAITEVTFKLEEQAAALVEYDAALTAATQPLVRMLLPGGTHESKRPLIENLFDKIIGKSDTVRSRYPAQAALGLSAYDFVNQQITTVARTALWEAPGLLATASAVNLFDLVGQVMVHETPEMVAERIAEAAKIEADRIAASDAERARILARTDEERAQAERDAVPTKQDEFQAFIAVAQATLQERLDLLDPNTPEARAIQEAINRLGASAGEMFDASTGSTAAQAGNTILQNILSEAFNLFRVERQAEDERARGLSPLGPGEAPESSRIASEIKVIEDRIRAISASGDVTAQGELINLRQRLTDLQGELEGATGREGSIDPVAQELLTARQRTQAAEEEVRDLKGRLKNLPDPNTPEFAETQSALTEAQNRADAARQSEGTIQRRTGRTLPPVPGLLPEEAGSPGAQIGSFLVGVGGPQPTAGAQPTGADAGATAGGEVEEVEETDEERQRARNIALDPSGVAQETEDRRVALTARRAALEAQFLERFTREDEGDPIRQRTTVQRAREEARRIAEDEAANTAGGGAA